MGETMSMVLSPLKTAGVASLTRTSHGTITIPEGHDGRLRRVELYVLGTLETVLCGGGLVEITNPSIPEMIFKAVVGGGCAVTEGGGHQNEPQVYKCDFAVIGGSTYTFYLTAYDNQNQTLHAELIYEIGGKPDKSRPNYIDADFNLQATVLTQVTINENNNEIEIVKNRGGTLLFAEFMVFPTGETVVNAGGKVKVKSTVDSWLFESFAGGLTVLGASGGVQLKPNRKERSLKVTGNSKIKTDYTPYDNQEQTMSLTIGISMG